MRIAPRVATAALVCAFGLLAVAATAAAGDADFDRGAPSGVNFGDTSFAPVPDSPPDTAPSDADFDFEIDRNAAGDRYFAGELLVIFEDSATAPEIRETADDAGAEITSRIPEIDSRLLEFPEVLDIASDDRREDVLQDAKSELQATPGVESVDYNYVLEQFATVNDPLQQFQWGMERIGITRAFDASTGAGTRMVIIDGGLDFFHPEFNGAVAGQAEYFTATPGDGIAEDNNGHGTHVAGIASATTNNGFGVVGASPQSALFIGKVCDGPQGQCNLEAAAAALIDAANIPGGIDVANLSLGGPNNVPVMEQAVNYATSRDVLVVVAMGNTGDQTPQFPASYANSFAVTSSDINDGISTFSTTGPQSDISAPGGTGGFPGNPQDILSTVPGFLGSFDYKNGTSMSSPHVAGVAALLAAQGNNAGQIRSQLENTSTDLGFCGYDPFYGAGRLDASAALGQTPRQTNCISAAGGPSEKCLKARKKLNKAIRKLKKAIKRGTNAQVQKAKRKVRNAKRKVIAACGSL
jgi:thermitase